MKKGKNNYCNPSHISEIKFRQLGGRGTASKTPIFGLLKRDGKAFVDLVTNYSKELILRAHSTLGGLSPAQFERQAPKQVA